MVILEDMTHGLELKVGRIHEFKHEKLREF